MDKLCPLRKNDKGTFDVCLKEKCAWYDDDDMCSVQSLTMISETLLKIYYDKNEEWKCGMPALTLKAK